MSDNALPIVDLIPSPEDIRARLAENMREADVLRSLLRAADRKARFDRITNENQKHIRQETHA